ncbi:MAG: hypothetical protein IJ713_01170 [Oscillibacter sp.]|nr:hypothetical protein [Oscillibacter sp.]
MRILDLEGNELFDPDHELGRAEVETVVTVHHEAVEAVEEVWHYETLRVYPNGGKDVVRVVDVPGVAAQDAWDETEEILRWHPYSAEELAQREHEREAMAREAAEAEEADRLAAEALERENARLKAQVAALMENQQFLEDCIAEMAEIVYA